MNRPDESGWCESLSPSQTSGGAGFSIMGSCSLSFRHFISQLLLILCLLVLAHRALVNCEETVYVLSF